MLLERITKLEAELAEARQWKDKWETCEKWRKFYQEAKGKLYAMGGEVAEACWNHMPCNEAQIDQWFRGEFVYKEAYDRVGAELEAARKDSERLRWILCNCELVHAGKLRNGKPVYLESLEELDAARGAK